MSQQLTVQLADDVYRALADRAAAAGTSPSLVAVAALEEFAHHDNGRRESVAGPSEAAKEAARARFLRNLGAVRLNHPTGSDNKSIDADLARECLDTYEND